MQFEEEELHEQIAHSQEIIEKLTDVEEELKERYIFLLPIVLNSRFF